MAKKTKGALKKDETVIELMLERFKLSAEAESDNRKRGLKAIKFRMGGEYQWDDAMWQLRGKWNQPRESYNQIPQFLHQVTNDLRMNMPQIRFIPGTDGDKETATVREDLVRAIQAESDAEVAYDAAVDNQTSAGWGYFKILTEYANKKNFDQIIKIGWVPNVFTIYDDPYTLLQDRSDRGFLFEVSDEPVRDFNKTFDKSYSDDEFKSIGDKSPSWGSYKDRTIRVAAYWSVEEKIDKTIYRNTESGKVSETEPDDMDGWEKRDIMKRTAIQRKCTAIEVLEESEWPGEYIPYVYVAGEEIIVDGKRHLSGIIESMIPAQKGYNQWMNAATELTMLAPKAQYLLDPEQIEGYEDVWDRANINNYPYLPFRSIINGQAYPAPQRAQNSADLSSIASLIALSQENLYKSSGVSQSGLGYKSNESSGKAILARQKEGDISTYHFGDNLSRAMRCAGRILDDLIPIIYDTPRELDLRKEDGSTYKVKVNEPYMDKNKRKHYDLTSGTYRVVAVTGPSFSTKRQESAETLIQLAGTTNLMEVAPDVVYSAQDFPGADKIAERYKKMLPPQLQDDEDNPIPPQVKMQMQQMEQLTQELGAQVQQLTQELQSKQGDIANKQADLQLKQQEMIAKGQSESDKAQLDQLKIQLEADKLEFERERLATETQLANQKMDLEATKMRIDAKANMSPDMAMVDPDLYNGISPIQQMMENMAQVLSDGLAQVANITAQSSEAVVQSNVAVAQALTQPKQVIVQRDSNNLMAGAIVN